MSWFHMAKLVRPVNQEADMINTLAVSQYKSVCVCVSELRDFTHKI